MDFDHLDHVLSGNGMGLVCSERCAGVRANHHQGKTEPERGELRDLDVVGDKRAW
jgi:hypothetical protein